jgi:hypothetical protein
VKRGIATVAIADIPRPELAGVQDPPSCVDVGAGDCAFDRSAALTGDPLVQAAAATNGVTLINLTNYFCAGTRCPSVIGDVLVYRDADHMTSVYARSLAPAFEAALKAAGLEPAR